MKRTSTGELRSLLVDLGVQPGDKVFVHAFVPSLGIVEGGIEGITETLLDQLGPEGTLIVPTFTASYRRNQIYDVKTSRSYNGALSEFVRQLSITVRSEDPLFSMAALGKDATALMKRSSSNCFGHGSIYDRLFRNRVKFLGFGIDWDQGFSFFMHLERLASVPYRCERTFRGCTRLCDGSLVEDIAVHFVRRETFAWVRDRGPLCEQLLAEGKIHQVARNGCKHRLFESPVIERAFLGHLREQPWCMAQKLP